MSALKKIAILTSGGDAPGMNACIRAIVRVGLQVGFEIIGFLRGYEGVVRRNFVDLNSRSVSNIIQRGGTILHTARCPEFQTEGGLRTAADVLTGLNVGALLVIGGDGSLRGCHDLAKHWQGQIIGLPGTIDNDLAGTDFTIGFDTAVNTALDAIDKIRDTADAHGRAFLIEVMGRHAGFIAMAVGMAGGAEEILIPEEPPDFNAICARIMEGKRLGKTSMIIIVAEGAVKGGAVAASEALRLLTGIDNRVCVLGHIQRGGSPTAADRLLATKLGGYAIEAVKQGKTGVMVGEVKGELVLTPVRETWEQRKMIQPFLKKLGMTLAT